MNNKNEHWIRDQNSPNIEKPKTTAFIGEFYKHLRKIINDNLYQNLTDNGTEETHSKSFYEATITMKPNARTKKSGLSDINITDWAVSLSLFLSSFLLS